MRRHYSAFVDDEAVEDSEIDSTLMEEEELGIKSDLDRLLGGGKAEDLSSGISDSTDDDDGSDLRDFIVQDDDDESPSPYDHSIYRQREDQQRVLCERCRCRVGTPPSKRNAPSPTSSTASVEVVIGGSSSPSSDPEQRSIWNKMTSTTSPKITCTMGGLISSSASSVVNDPDPPYVSLDDETEDEMKETSVRRPSPSPFTICRATSVYLQPVKKRKRSLPTLDATPPETTPNNNTRAPPVVNRQTDRIPKKSQKPQVDGLFDNIPMEELRQAQESAEETHYMAAVGSDLHHANVKETLRDCSLGSSVLLIQDAWGGEAEIYPYREYIKANERGDSDDVQAHYVKGPRDAQGKGDMFVLVRESIIDEMVPMKFGDKSKHIKVKVFNTKVSMIKALDVAKHMANSSAGGCQKPVKSGTSPDFVKRKRRREQWHSLKWRRLQNQVAAVRAPWLRAARYGGAAYQWQR